VATGTVSSVAEEIKVTRRRENGKKESCFVLGIWSRKFQDSNDLQKQNQKYYCV